MPIEMIDWGPGREYDWTRRWLVVPRYEQVSGARWIWIMIEADEPITPRFQIAGCRWEAETVYGCWHPFATGSWVLVVVYRRVSDPPEGKDAG